jgi:20S proteasome alpha/beta subunit
MPPAGKAAPAAGGNGELGSFRSFGTHPFDVGNAIRHPRAAHPRGIIDDSLSVPNVEKFQDYRRSKEDSEPCDVPNEEGYPSGELPLRQDVTVGIAACTFYENEKAIILCCDWQGTFGYVKSENTDKTRWIGAATALISGTLTEADELLNASEPAVKAFLAKTDAENSDLHINALLADLRSIAQTRKRALMSEFFALNVGMNYDEFVRKGKTQFHQSHYDSLWGAASRLSLGASILYAMFDADRDPVLILLRQDGKVRWEDQYAAIGSGGEIAHAMLSTFDFNASMTFLPCLYEVHRAKVASESDIYVGKTSTYEVLLNNGQRFDLSDALYKYVNNRVRGYKTPKLTFSGEYLTSIR